MKIRKIIEIKFYRTDLTPKEVNDELHERCKAAGEKIPMKSTQRKLIKTLTVSGFDIREFGE